MKKIKLNLDEIQVQSFETVEAADRPRGTVIAQTGYTACYNASCPSCVWTNCGTCMGDPGTCYTICGTCYTDCGSCPGANTCDDSCGGTCIETCGTCDYSCGGTCGDWTCDRSTCTCEL